MNNLWLILFLFTTSVLLSQEKNTVSFEELPSKMQAEPRPILIKVHTKWCSICKIQDKRIEKSPELKKALSEKVYYLQLDAETKETIVFNNKVYKFIPHGTTGGLHELAAHLCGTGNAYPCWVILSPGYKKLSQYSGLLTSRELLKTIGEKL